MTNEKARLQASAPKVFVYIFHKQNYKIDTLIWRDFFQYSPSIMISSKIWSLIWKWNNNVIFFLKDYGKKTSIYVT